MPPRIPGAQRLGTFSLCLRPAPTQVAMAPTLPLIQAASLSDKAKRKIARQDPYRWRQMVQRKAVNVERRKIIDDRRAAEFGDPIRGITTPFVESFDSAGQAPMTPKRIDDQGNVLEESRPLPTSPHVLNHHLHRKELDSAIHNAYVLTRPVQSAIRDGVDPVAEKAALDRHDDLHKRAVEAINRITDLNNGSAYNRKHANIRRCVETFGRHVTDTHLRPKPLSRGQPDEEKPVRGGPDTGSSEVQIAILTVKIRALANALEINRGHKDKVNKRNLRLLVHRRQRLLQYMEKKEKRGDRWKHMCEKLGISPATYKGQITL